MYLAGLRIPDEDVRELVRLVDEPTRSFLEKALALEAGVVALTMEDRERILWALDDVRTDAMPASLSGALLEHRMRSRFKASTDYVFSTREGTALDGRNVSRMFTATLKRAGLPTIRFHDLRHTFASLLIHQGAHTEFVSEQLGHASSQITLDRYGHLLDQSYSDESEKLEAALFGDADVVPIAEGAKRA
jgi:integrase